MGEAFLWGAVAGSSLVIGGIVALRAPITRRHVGLIMAFGAGVLLSAVAYELVQEAFETSAGEGGIALGLLAGSLVFFLAEVLIDRLGKRRNPQPGEGDGPGTAAVGRALVLGIILDGIPESLVLGLTVLEAGTVSAAFLVAVFVANLPEAIAATAALERAGRDTKRIMRFWVLVALGFGVASLAGYVLLEAASPRTGSARRLRHLRRVRPRRSPGCRDRMRSATASATGRWVWSPRWSASALSTTWSVRQRN